MWFNGCVADTKDEKTLLTIGEAAELAGVALLDLRRHIRAGRLKTTRAQRLGDELDLLSLKQLIHVCPSAGRREYRPELSLRERGIELVVRDMQVPQLLPLKPHLEPEAKPLEAREPAPAEERALPQVGLEVEQLERQIEALKAQVQRARERNQSLLQKLEMAGADAPLGLDDEAQPALRRSRFRDRVQGEYVSLDRKLSEVGGGSSAAAWLVGSAAVVSGLLLVMWARSPVYAAASVPNIPRADQARERQSAVLGALLESAAASRRAAEREGSMAVLPALESEPDAVPDPVAVVAQVPERISPKAAVETPEQTPLEPEPLELAAKIEAEPAAVSSGDPCEMFPLTSAGQPLREVLGPCLGPWNPTEEAVVGSHRRGGKTWCRQHFVIASELGGSVVRAKQIADFARREGLTPPLMQMRIDLAAQASLTEHAGAWIESGFESGTPMDHTAVRQEGRDCWRLDSWVRLADEQGHVNRRIFRVQLALGGAEYLDRVLDFEWLD